MGEGTCFKGEPVSSLVPPLDSPSSRPSPDTPAASPLLPDRLPAPAARARTPSSPPSSHPIAQGLTGYRRLSTRVVGDWLPGLEWVCPRARPRQSPTTDRDTRAHREGLPGPAALPIAHAHCSRPTSSASVHRHKWPDSVAAYLRTGTVPGRCNTMSASQSGGDSKLFARVRPPLLLMCSPSSARCPLPRRICSVSPCWSLLVLRRLFFVSRPPKIAVLS